MTRDDYLEVLATEPATATQVGAVVGEFRRLGVTDRAERLEITSELLDIDGLSSTCDLVMGEAGWLLAFLRNVRDRDELPDVGPLDDEADGQGDGPATRDSDEVHPGDRTWGDVVVSLRAALRKTFTQAT